MAASTDTFIHSAHAHPSPDAAPHDDPDGVRRLFGDITIDLQLRGLPGAHRSKVTDIYSPELRRSPFSAKYHVNHLDVVSCWKGMNLDQAAELAQWELMFHEALESQMVKVLRGTLVQYLQAHPAHHASIMSCLTQSISDQGTRRLEVDIWRLVHEMIILFYGTHGSASLGYGWFGSSGDLPAMVYNFVRTRDCFFDAFPRPYLEIELSYTQEGSELYIVGNITWQPPNIEFVDLPVTLKPGVEYQITPRYATPDLGSSSGPDFPKFSEETEFTIDSESLPLKWDQDSGCFHAVVPATSHPEDRQDATSSSRPNDFLLDLNDINRKTHHAETKFSAKIVFPFPGNARFERATRYSIKLDVSEPTNPQRAKSSLPRVRPWVPSYTHTPLSKCGGEATESPAQSSVERKIKATGTESTIREKDDCCDTPDDTFAWTGKPAATPEGNDYFEYENKIFAWNTCSASVDKQIANSRGLHQSSEDRETRTFDFRGKPPQKRKATKQVPLSSMFDKPPAFEETRLALDQFEHLDLELTAKRQKLDKRIDSSFDPLNDASFDELDADEDWHDKYLSGLGDVTTRCLGKALANASPAANSPGWSKRLSNSDDSIRSRYRSRAYEAGLADSKVVPSLRKKGSVKRMIFSRHYKADSPMQCATPEDHESPSSAEYLSSDRSLSQGEIQNNYKEFLVNRQGKATARKARVDGARSDDECNAYEDIFLEGSQAGSWCTETDDLSADFEKVPLVEAAE